MAGAMLHRWVASGFDVRRFTVIDPGTPNAPDGIRCLKSVPDEAPPAWLMIGVKPQILADVTGSITPFVTAETSILSILAGTRHDTLAAFFPQAGRIVRVMPNLPVAIGRGVVALHGTDHRPDVTALMAPLGLVEWIDDENLLDAVTALSGSGPAFVYRFAEALTAGGTAMGLDRDLADRLARATIAGAGAMAQTSRAALADLVESVASKGGSTRAGLDVLDNHEVLMRLITETVAAAQHRNVQLAQLSGAD
jgi:pyrroline-5-carboxylate reductase